MDVRKPAVPRPIAGQTGNANAQPAGDAAGAGEAGYAAPQASQSAQQPSAQPSAHAQAQSSQVVQSSSANTNLDKAAAITLQVCYRIDGAPRLYLHVLVSIGL